MPDLRELLDDAAPKVRDIETAPIRRGAARRRAVPRILAVAAAMSAVVVGVVVATSGGGSTNRIETGTSPTTVAPTTTPPPTTTEVPATTTAPPPTTPLGEDRLSTESRLGYAGLGPIKLGMAFDDAVAAAHVTAQPDPTCYIALYGEPGSGVDSITVWGYETVDTINVFQPAIRTISGIGVGSSRADVLATYPSVVAEGSSLFITGPYGELIFFAIGPDEMITGMTLTSSREAVDQHGRC